MKVDPRERLIVALDVPSVTEAKVNAALDEVMKGRTTFVIAHRLSTIRNATRILVFDAGRIVEEGTHLTLSRQAGGIYRALFERQVIELGGLAMDDVAAAE